MVRKSKNLEKSQKIIFFKKSESFENILVSPKKNNPILLVLPIEEISLRPELSSQAHFRIQGGYPERDTGGVVGIVVAGRHFSFLI